MSDKIVSVVHYIFSISSLPQISPFSFFFFFNDTATTEIYTLSLHDALPISACRFGYPPRRTRHRRPPGVRRSEEHTSELQSRPHLVCRLLLEKKKQTRNRFLSVRNKNKKTAEPESHSKM